MTEMREVLYDADGNEVDDAAHAVRGATLEVDDDGNVVREVESWRAERSGSVEP